MVGHVQQDLIFLLCGYIYMCNLGSGWWYQNIDAVAGTLLAVGCCVVIGSGCQLPCEPNPDSQAATGNKAAY